MSSTQQRDRVLLFNTASPTVAATTTTLAADITDTTSTAVTLAAAVLPTNGVYIEVGTERMLVLSGAGSVDLVVSRGAWGTTAATYTSGDTVNIPGYNTYQLPKMATVGTHEFYCAKNTTDINYQIVNAYSGDSFPGGATNLILSDNSAGLGNVFLLAPEAGSQWLQSAGGPATFSGGAPTTVTNSLIDRAVLFAGFGAPILPNTTYPTQHIVQDSSVPTALFARLANPQGAGDFIFDVQYSADSGVTWGTILASDITIPPGDSNVISSSSFAPGVQLAAGNLVKLVVVSSGLGPNYASGFTCTVLMKGTTIAGFDKATFRLGYSRYVPIAQDMGVYWINTSTSQAISLSVDVTVLPEEGNVSLDLQYQVGDSWVSLFEGGTPLTITPTSTGVITTNSFDPTITILPGTLIRPYFVSGPSTSGMQYNIALKLSIIP